MAIPLESMSGIIDQIIFEQLLEMDEDGDYEFSKSITEDYFEQAKDGFDKMAAALSAAPPDLTEAGKLGHFLKGSSAAIGVTKVKNICEKIQHWGALKDPIDGTPFDKDEALRLIQENLAQAREDFEEAKLMLQKFFGDVPDDQTSTASPQQRATDASSIASPSYSRTSDGSPSPEAVEGSPTRSIHSHVSRQSPERPHPGSP